MLQSIRDKTSGWIAYLIIFLISIPFALWGLNSYFEGGAATSVVATVDGQDISQQDLDMAYANYRRRLAQVFGGTIPETFNDEGMKDHVLTQMIEEFALGSYVDRNNYRIGDEQLNHIIRSIEMFQTDGQFEPEIYQQQVASLGYSTAGFESELRRARTMEQFETGIMATTFSTPDVRQKLASLSNQTRSIRWLTKFINNENHTVDDKEIEEYFAKNQSRYVTEEQAKVDYIELSLDGIKRGIEIDPAEIRHQYEQSKEIYTSDEIRTASHILLTLPANASAEESQQVFEQLNDIRAQLDAGSDFAELAKAHSQDPLSAKEGGHLGEVERGMMVQPFETALFDLQVDQISQPIKTSFGWHLIKLEGVSGGEVRPFTGVSAAIEDEIRTESAESQIYDLTENLANLVYEQPDSLSSAAEQLGLVMQTSDWFGRHSAEAKAITAEAKIRSAAFSPNVLTRGLNSEAIELSDGRVVFIRLNAHKPAMPKSLQAVKTQIIAEIKQNKSRQSNIDTGEKALAALRSKQQSLDSIATDWDTDLLEAPELNRGSQTVDRQILALAFSMAKPDPDPVFQGFTHANGDYSIVQLLSVTTVDTAALSTEQMTAFDRAIADQEYQSVLRFVNSRAEVTKAASDR